MSVKPPKITVVIATHLKENDKYLSNCLLSLKRSVGVDLEIIVASSREDTLVLDHDIRVLNVGPEMDQITATNLATDARRLDSKYIFQANDDIIVSKTALIQMVGLLGDNRAIMHPVSNCDNGWLFTAVFGIFNHDGVRLPEKRFYTYDEVVGYEWPIMNYPPGINVASAFNFMCNYAQLIPNQVWMELGPYDVNMKYGFVDTDYAIRARNANIPLLCHYGAFVFHYGGATSNKTQNEERRKISFECFDKKYGEGAHQRFI